MLDPIRSLLSLHILDFLTHPARLHLINRILIDHPPSKRPLHLRAQRKLAQVVRLLRTRNESLLRQVLILEPVEALGQFLDLRHACGCCARAGVGCVEGRERGGGGVGAVAVGREALGCDAGCHDGPFCGL